jgi:hypothetical protein
VKVVEVHDAVARDAVVSRREQQLGHQASPGSCERGDDDGPDAIGDRV